MTISITREQWNGRAALRLSNGACEVVTLPGGGHLAALRLASEGEAGVNCLWTPPWPTADPDAPRAVSLAGEYGADPAARLLAGYAGHALCLDLFGPPSEREAALGVALHGEAAVRTWSFESTPAGCMGRVDLPVARLSFERQLTLAPSSAVLWVEERVTNRGAEARDLHWVQHVALGPPFLAPGESLLGASLDRGLTSPSGYDGHELLRDHAQFDWPHAPALDGSAADLRVPFARPGTGYLAAARVSLARDVAFIAALNFRIGLALVYCFRRRDFPWVAIWEENRARAGAPWNEAVQARGMEFGTTPMPVGREALRSMGTLLDTPSTRAILPGSMLDARYLAALAKVPAGWRSIAEVRCESRALRLIGEPSGASVEIPAEGLFDFLERDWEN